MNDTKPDNFIQSWLKLPLASKLIAAVIVTAIVVLGVYAESR